MLATGSASGAPTPTSKQKLPQSLRECHALLIEQRRQIQEQSSISRDLRDRLQAAEQEASALRLQGKVAESQQSEGMAALQEDNRRLELEVQALRAEKKELLQRALQSSRRARQATAQMAKAASSSFAQTIEAAASARADARERDRAFGFLPEDEDAVAQDSPASWGERGGTTSGLPRGSQGRGGQGGALVGGSGGGSGGVGGEDAVAEQVRRRAREAADALLASSTTLRQRRAGRLGADIAAGQRLAREQESMQRPPGTVSVAGTVPASAQDRIAAKSRS